MPLYEYECKKCHHRFEKIQSFSAPEETACPKCGSEIERVISAPAVQFKGTGWYVTDYARKGGSNTAKSESGDSGSESKASESKTGDSKTTESKPSESKSESKPASDSSSSSSEKK